MDASEHETTLEKGNRHENEATSILKRVYGAGVEKVDAWGNHDPFGFVDVIAIKEGWPVKFIQVKTNTLSAEAKQKYKRRTRHLPLQHAELEVWVRIDRKGWDIYEFDGTEFALKYQIPICDSDEAGDRYRELVDANTKETSTHYSVSDLNSRKGLLSRVENCLDDYQNLLETTGADEDVLDTLESDIEEFREFKKWLAHYLTERSDKE